MAGTEEPRKEYTVLARRFRPQAFEDVVGQEHVAQALRNSILQGRVAHAYLFTGARGVGKTSSARILAKSLNCPNAVNGNPCQTCEVCQGVSTGSDVDVLEIDGASNRGIDDIRALRQNVNVRSMRSKYKIYIIDEVHMLTKEAFNALLKTLEEPPANVKFIFCTTEPNKVPDTILSRCQRYDFGTIATSSIKGRLAEIARAEGKTVDDAALEIVARRAAGSMRDSQSLFDQLLAFGEDQIRAVDVHRLLGTAPDERLTGIMRAVISHQQADVLRQLHLILEEGVQVAEFTDQLMNYTRDLLIVAAGANEVPLQSVAADCFETLKEQAKVWGFRNIVAGMQILADTKGKMRGTTYGRALTELALIRLTFLEDLNALENVIAALRSGQFNLGGTVAGKSPQSFPLQPTRPVAPPGGSSSSTPKMGEFEKKNEPTIENKVQAPQPSQNPPAELAQSASPTVPQAEIPPVVIVELRAGEEATFMTQLLSQLTGILRDNLKKASPSASFGPNQLVFSFEKRYDLARQYCERSDNLARVREVASQITGRAITVSFRSVANENAELKTAPPSVGDPKSPGPQTRKSAGSEPKVTPDSFVLKAAEVFHGKFGEPTPLN